MTGAIPTWYSFAAEAVNTSQLGQLEGHTKKMFYFIVTLDYCTARCVGVLLRRVLDCA